MIVLTPSIALFVLILTLNAADIYTTVYVINHGGRELNKVMAWFMKVIGVLPALVLTKGAALALLYVYLDTLPIWFLVVVTLVYLIVVGSNVRQMRRM